MILEIFKIMFCAKSSFDKDLSKRALKAAEYAWEWAKKNPKILFNNPEGIRTGSYADVNVEDEWFWAASEMFITTKQSKYYQELGETRYYHCDGRFEA